MSNVFFVAKRILTANDKEDKNVKKLVHYEYKSNIK